MSDKNTESVLYVHTLIITKNDRIRVFRLMTFYKGYEQNILKFLKTSF